MSDRKSEEQDTLTIVLVGIGYWGQGDKETRRQGDNFFLLPIPHAQCPMPIAQCPMPNALTNYFQSTCDIRFFA
ncbi:hypothetical protein H6G81_30885 [Scytonema hofmannii FACHB-248]|uniref:Uncharacterized protein n=2 Tax=Nostocales TaxID=1161 RepID=A0ABR8GZ39_9CYAN|nr:hypothetical protein [Scytonema hofmannii]MBD2608807.1 hypothetical protein [Scytonema hofmannii FACHB-248]